MAEKTGISWTDSTFNPWRGCTKISEGCKLCYAARMAPRNPKVLGVWGPQGTRVLAAEKNWKDPIKWNEDAALTANRHKVFCCSLADVFEDWDGQMSDVQGRLLFLNPHTNWTGNFITFHKMEVPDGEGRPYTLSDARKRLWDLIRQTPWLDWQILTKRPENIRRFMPWGEWPNVWLGVSIEDMSRTMLIDLLLESQSDIKVPVRFVSAEPLLGPLEIGPSLGPNAINWLIVGGESGAQARPFNVDWAHYLIAQCDLAQIPCFVKQMGSNPVHGYRTGISKLGKGDDPSHWPIRLRVQQFPELEEQE